MKKTMSILLFVLISVCQNIYAFPDQSFPGVISERFLNSNCGSSFDRENKDTISVLLPHVNDEKSKLITIEDITIFLNRVTDSLGYRFYSLQDLGNQLFLEKRAMPQGYKDVLHKFVVNDENARFLEILNCGYKIEYDNDMMKETGTILFRFYYSRIREDKYEETSDVYLIVNSKTDEVVKFVASKEWNY